MLEVGGLFDEPIEFYHGRVPFVVVGLITQLEKNNSNISNEIFNPEFSGEDFDDFIDLLKTKYVMDWSPFKNVASLSIALVYYINSLARNGPLVSEDVQELLIENEFDDSDQSLQLLRKILIKLYPGRYRTVLFLANYLRSIKTVNENRLFRIFSKALFGQKSLDIQKNFLKSIFKLILHHHETVFYGAVLGEAAFLSEKQIAGLIKKHKHGEKVTTHHYVGNLSPKSKSCRPPNVEPVIRTDNENDKEDNDILLKIKKIPNSENEGEDILEVTTPYINIKKNGINKKLTDQLYSDDEWHTTLKASCDIEEVQTKASNSPKTQNSNKSKKYILNKGNKNLQSEQIELQDINTEKDGQLFVNKPNATANSISEIQYGGNNANINFKRNTQKVDNLSETMSNNSSTGSPGQTKRKNNLSEKTNSNEQKNNFLSNNNNNNINQINNKTEIFSLKKNKQPIRQKEAIKSTASRSSSSSSQSFSEENQCFKLNIPNSSSSSSSLVSSSLSLENATSSVKHLANVSKTPSPHKFTFTNQATVFDVRPETARKATSDCSPLNYSPPKNFKSRDISIKNENGNKNSFFMPNLIIDSSPLVINIDNNYDENPGGKTIKGKKPLCLQIEADQNLVIDRPALDDGRNQSLIPDFSSSSNHSKAHGHKHHHRHHRRRPSNDSGDKYRQCKSATFSDNNKSFDDSSFRTPPNNTIPSSFNQTFSESSSRKESSSSSSSSFRKMQNKKYEIDEISNDFSTLSLSTDSKPRNQNIDIPELIPVSLNIGGTNKILSPIESQKKKKNDQITDASSFDGQHSSNKSKKSRASSTCDAKNKGFHPLNTFSTSSSSESENFISTTAKKKEVSFSDFEEENEIEEPEAASEELPLLNMPPLDLFFNPQLDPSKRQPQKNLNNDNDRVNSKTLGSNISNNMIGNENNNGKVSNYSIPANCPSGLNSNIAPNVKGLNTSPNYNSNNSRNLQKNGNQSGITGEIPSKVNSVPLPLINNEVPEKRTPSVFRAIRSDTMYSSSEEDYSVNKKTLVSSSPPSIDISSRIISKSALPPAPPLGLPPMEGFNRGQLPPAPPLQHDGKPLFIEENLPPAPPLDHEHITQLSPAFVRSQMKQLQQQQQQLQQQKEKQQIVDQNVIDQKKEFVDKKQQTVEQKQMQQPAEIQKQQQQQLMQQQLYDQQQQQLLQLVKQPPLSVQQQQRQMNSTDELMYQNKLINPQTPPALLRPPSPTTFPTSAPLFSPLHDDDLKIGSPAQVQNNTHPTPFSLKANKISTYDMPSSSNDESTSTTTTTASTTTYPSYSQSLPEQQQQQQQVKEESTPLVLESTKERKAREKREKKEKEKKEKEEKRLKKEQEKLEKEKNKKLKKLESQKMKQKK